MPACEGTKGTMWWAYAEIGLRTGGGLVCDFCVPQEKITGKFGGALPKASRCFESKKKHTGQGEMLK